MEATFRKRRKPVGNSCRLDETSIRVNGEWMYLYGAADKVGNTVDFLLTKRRNKYAAHKFLIKAISNNGSPKVINMDQSGANKEAMKTYHKRCFKKIRVRLCKYLNNRVEADHRFIKWRIQHRLGFKSFESASRTLAGMERVRMIKKGQLTFPMATTYKTFCSLAASATSCKFSFPCFYKRLFYLRHSHKLLLYCSLLKWRTKATKQQKNIVSSKAEVKVIWAISII